MVTTIGSLNNVPDPGSDIRSPWAQDVTRLGSHTFASKTALDAATWPGLADGAHAFVTDVGRHYVRWKGAWRAIADGTGVWMTKANQSIPNNSGTPVVWDAEAFDSDGFAAPGNANITIPAGLQGVYDITARVKWAAAGSYDAGIVIAVGSDQYPVIGANLYGAMGAHASTAIAAAVVCTVQVVQVSGAALVASQVAVYMMRRP